MPATLYGLAVFDGKLKVDSNGVVGVPSCDLAVGKGGNAQSWGIGKVGDVGRLRNGEVELRRKGILKEDLWPLLWMMGDALCGILTVVESEWSNDSSLHDKVSFADPTRTIEHIRSHTRRSGMEPWRYALVGPRKGSTHCLFQSLWCKRAVESIEPRTGERRRCGMISLLKRRGHMVRGTLRADVISHHRDRDLGIAV